MSARGGLENELEGLLGRPIDNSKVVREIDPRSSRELWRLLALVGALVVAVVLYAWPHLELRQLGNASARLARTREQLLEENRKLRLERATLENLQRVETIATRELGLQAPPPERTVIVQRPRGVGEGSLVARGAAAPAPASN